MAATLGVDGLFFRRNLCFVALYLWYNFYLHCRISLNKIDLL